MTQTLDRPMSQKARTALMHREAQYYTAVEELKRLFTNPDATTEALELAQEWIDELLLKAGRLNKERNSRSWENRGREQSAAAETE